MAFVDLEALASDEAAVGPLLLEVGLEFEAEVDFGIEAEDLEDEFVVVILEVLEHLEDLEDFEYLENLELLEDSEPLVLEILNPPLEL